MSLDIGLTYNGELMWEGNITHNLGRMSRAAGAYEAVWTPDDPSDGGAPYNPRQVIDEIVPAINHLLYERHHYEQFNPENGWGDYDTLVRFLVDYALALSKFPNAEIKVSR
jgi:hypothetical protein